MPQTTAPFENKTILCPRVAGSRRAIIRGATNTIGRKCVESALANAEASESGIANDLFSVRVKIVESNYHMSIVKEGECNILKEVDPSLTLERVYHSMGKLERMAHEFKTIAERAIDMNTEYFDLLLANGEAPCSACGAPMGVEMAMRCSGCKMAHYCSHRCRKHDWKAGHKTKCQWTKLMHKTDVVNNEYVDGN